MGYLLWLIRSSIIETTSSMVWAVESTCTASSAGTSRGDLAAAVKLVALLKGVEGLVDLGLELRCAERLGVVLVTLQHAAAGALTRVGGQEDLDLRVREHDGADVAALGHDIAVLGGAALVDEHGGAHARIGRDLGHVGVDLRGCGWRPKRLGRRWSGACPRRCRW